MSDLRVTVWNEYRHEKKNPAVGQIYPNGMHATIASALRDAGGFTTRLAALDDPEHGLTDAVLDATDVLIWWGHLHHDDVQDAIAEKVKNRVLNGMGLIVLHSAHMAKPFLKLMGTSGALKWREDGKKEILWAVMPGHPITEGLSDRIVLEHEEMYGEHFDIPTPDELVFISWFEGGEVFRSGCCWRRGRGKIFYFRPGHEMFPTYFDANVRRVIVNATRWAAPATGGTPVYWHTPEPSHG